MAGIEHLCMNCMEEAVEGETCPHCGFQKGELQMRHALGYRTMLQGRYIVGKAKKCNGEGFTYIGYDTVLNCKIELREFFPQTVCGRSEPGGASVRIIGGSEILFDECLETFLTYSREIAHLRELSALQQIYDIFEENGTAYTVSEWNENITLRSFVERSGGNLNWNVARQLFMPVLNALGIMHSAGVCHLGISPDTLVILKDGKMKLVGFCISTVRRMDTDLPPDLMPGCAAIEQYVMDEPLGEPTDVYGFAATLFFALTGEMPQEAPKRRMDSRLLIPTSILKMIPPHVVTALANALQVSPQKRTATFERLRDELSAAPTVTAKIEASQPIRDLPPVRRPVQEKKGVPGFVWGIGSCVIALVVFTAIGFWWMTSGTSPEEEPVESSLAVLTPAVSGESSETVSQQESMPDTNVQMIDVPNLLGESYETIMAESSNSTQEYEVLLADKEFSDTVEEGKIISQTPEPGSKIARGGTITVVVSQGSEMRTLPDISGLSLAEASERVTAEGFMPVKEDVYSSTIEAGKMVGYKDASSGDKLQYGAQVIILMSIGPEST